MSVGLRRMTTIGSDAAESGRERVGRGAAAGIDGAPAASQSAWFGLAEDELDDERRVRGCGLQPADRAGPDLPRAGPAGRADPRRVSGCGCPWAGGTSWRSGYCVRVDREAPEGLDPMRIKELVEVLDPLPLIDRKMLELTRWLAEYYACSWGQALDAAVPAGVKKHAGTRVGTFLVVPEETREALRAGPIEPKLSAKQAAVLEILCRGDEPLTTADVCRLAKCGSGPVQALLKQGLVHTVRRRLPLGLGGPPAAARAAARRGRGRAAARAAGRGGGNGPRWC